MSFKYITKFSALILVTGFSFICSISAAQSKPTRYCGEEGIWVQVLGSGDLDLQNDRGAESYLVWKDDRAILLVNASAGTSILFDKSNANFSDLQAIVLTQTAVEQTSDLAALLVASRRSYREEPLTILGPTGDEEILSTSEFVTKLLGSDGPYPSLASLLTVRSPNGYTLRTKDIQAKGIRRWAGFGTEEFILSAIPVNHGGKPALAWRIDIDNYAIVFALGFNNQKDIVTEFSKDADVIVFTHALPVGTVGSPREKFLIPQQMGRIANRADVRFIILGGRGWRTLGRESRSLTEIETEYEGTIIFPDDLECWGL
ncbi:MAG: hypothetical protein OXG24_01880 [Gammaproteobacteria bacterium]|nr:hypothetical protein [Gammaproteobacteria bacterium]